AEHGEHDEDEPEPERAADRADDRGLAAVHVEDLGREQATDTEHRHEPEGQRHQGDTAEIDAEVERVEDPTEDVDDQDGNEEDATAHERADDEDEVFNRDLDHRPSGSSTPTPDQVPHRQDTTSRAPGRAPDV